MGRRALSSYTARYDVIEFSNCTTGKRSGSGLVYTMSDYFSCRIAFLNPVQKTLRSMSVYTKRGKQSSDTFRDKSSFGSASYRITMFTRETKRF